MNVNLEVADWTTLFFDKPGVNTKIVVLMVAVQRLGRVTCFEMITAYGTTKERVMKEQLTFAKF